MIFGNIRLQRPNAFGSNKDLVYFFVYSLTYYFNSFYWYFGDDVNGLSMKIYPFGFYVVLVL